MSDFWGKLSLYDILAMLVPGGTLYVFFLLATGFDLVIYEYEINPALAWTIALVVSYILGLINQTFTSILWSESRNNPNMIHNAYKKGKTIPIYHHVFIFFIPFSLIALSLLFAQLWPEKCVEMIVNEEFYIIFLILVIILILFIRIYIRNNAENEKGIIGQYYKMYYYVATHTYRKDIFIIEGQVAFLQSMLIPLSCLLLLPSSSFNLINGTENVCAIKLLLLFIILFSIPVIFIRQMKIYQCVKEDYEYLKRCEYEEKNKE